jgi:adenylate kinase
MRCFISAIDTPVGHNISRLLASTVVGSRKDAEPEEEEAEAGDDTEKNKNDDKKDIYQVIGTFSSPRPATGSSQEITSTLTPGTMVETGDKKKDQARRDAIDKFAVPFNKPRWAQDVISVGADDRNFIIFPNASRCSRCALLFTFLNSMTIVKSLGSTF